MLRAGAEHALTAQEVALLQHLAERAGRTVGREELCRAVWGEARPDSRALDFAVRRLREKLEPDPRNPRVLLSLRGAGLRLVLPGPDAPPVDEGPRLLTLGAITVDLESGEVEGGGGERRLTPQELRLLRLLAERPGELVTQAEALEHDLGYRSGTRTHTLDTTLARLRAQVERDPSRPRHLVTVRGRGLRLDLWPHNLPESPRAMLGRDLELARARSLSEGAAILTITGPGGVGKTRLLLALGRALLARGGLMGGLWLLDLSSARSGAELVQALASLLALPLPERDLLAPRTLERVGRAAGARGRGAFLLDNLEQIHDAATAVSGLAAASPELVWLCTSRHRLDLPEERVLELGPLAQPDAERLLVQVASACGALSLDGQVVAALAERLGGLPLAIELAAARAGLLGAEAVLARLDRQLDLLAQGGRPHRHSSLRLSVESSWALLDADQQSALARLSALHQPFSWDAAEAALGPGLDPALLLPALRARSLLQDAEGPGGEPRFAMLVSIRQLAAERLEERGERSAVRARVLAYMARYATTLFAGTEGPEPDEARQVMRFDLPAFEDIWGEAGDPEDAVRIGLALLRFLKSLGLSAHVGRMATAIRASCGDDLLATRERALLWGWLLYAATDEQIPDRGPLIDVLVRHARERGDPEVLCVALMSSCVFHRLKGEDLARGDAHGREAREIARIAGLTYLQIWCGMQLVEYGVLSLEDGGRVLERELRRAEQLGSLALVILIRFSLARSCTRRGDHERARHLLLLNLETSRRSPEPGRQVRFLGWLALVEMELGELAAAEEALRQGLVLSREIGSGAFEAVILRDWALVFLIRGEQSAAERALQEAERASRSARVPEELVVIRAYQGLERQLRGDLPTAEARYEETLERMYRDDMVELRCAALSWQAILLGEIAPHRRGATIERLHGVSASPGVPEAARSMATLLARVEREPAAVLAELEARAARGLEPCYQRLTAILLRRRAAALLALAEVSG